MSNMDYNYWNLNPLVLDKGEEVKEELLKYYELGYDEDSKTNHPWKIELINSRLSIEFRGT